MGGFIIESIVNYEESVFESVVVIVFYSEMYQNNFFYFFKNYFL